MAPPSATKSRPRSRSASVSRRKSTASPKAAVQTKQQDTSNVKSAAVATVDSDLWGGQAYSSAIERHLRTSLGPLLLLVGTPVFINVAALTALRHDSSFSNLWASYTSVEHLLAAAFPVPTATEVQLFVSFVLFQLLLFVTLPGKVFNGAVAPSGFVPRFKRHGGLAFVITAGVFLYGSLHAGWFSPTVIYDRLLPLMTLLNFTALTLAGALLVKGIVSPSTPDCGSNESWMFRLYWGEELYPSVFGVDLKHFVICRLGMTGWFLFTLSFTFAAIRNGGAAVAGPGASLWTLATGLRSNPTLAASVVLNMAYVAKFFILFEVPGYMSAADIAVDRFGFMLAWGTLAFMPLVHNLQTLHLVKGTGTLGLTWTGAAAWIAVGLVMIFLNYDADTQRHRVRAAGGKCIVWGRPAEVIKASYKDAQGKSHSNLLLCCGYLGLVRHFHYLPDIVLLFLYCAPSGFGRVLPFTYFIYLTSLLLDRCQRIDARCAAKYGKYWKEYCRRVPYKLLPGLF